VSRSAVILRNVASNWVGFAVNAAITFLLTPFILHTLGVARYGIWTITASIVGYYGLLDIGVRAGICQYLVRYIAARDYEKAAESLTTAVGTLCALGLVFVALSLGAALLAPSVFDFPEASQHEAFWCILIVGCSASFQFPLSAFPAVFQAKQRFDLANLIGVVTRLLTAIVIVVVLKLDGGLIGLSAATCGMSLLDYTVRAVVALRLVPELRGTGAGFRLERLREIASFGAWNFLMSINSYVFTHVPNILIGWYMPIAAVGHYALGMGLSRQVNSVLAPVGQVMYPAAAELHVQSDHAGLRRLYHDGSRLMMLVAFPTILAAAIFATDFYRLWIGEKFLSESPFHSVALIFRILMLAIGISYLSSIGQQILISAGHVRQVAMALVSASMLTILLSVNLIGPFGLAGVASAVVVGAIAGDLIAMPILLSRLLGLSVMDYIREACPRPFAAGLLQAVWLESVLLAGAADTWLKFALKGIVAVLGCAAIAALIGITREERQRFLFLPLRRLWHRGSEHATEG
jgi:O-antigen/teichoic acid export membrane protein